jgi:hypothetical protein
MSPNVDSPNVGIPIDAGESIFVLGVPSAGDVGLNAVVGRAGKNV